MEWKIGKVKPKRKKKKERKDRMFKGGKKEERYLGTKEILIKLVLGRGTLHPQLSAIKESLCSPSHRNWGNAPWKRRSSN